ncbi:RNA polymerase sigma factor [Dietzia sp.]|uniref:RNA polymerase sigma factor n=1 Tax=Dietzia sp. TaxID=1871616 RepID=UPI002FD9F333
MADYSSQVDPVDPAEAPTAPEPESRSDGDSPRAVAGINDALVAAAVMGESRAIGVLFSVLNPRLTRYLVLMVGREADDIASETWVEVMRSLPRYIGGADTIGAWVIGIGRNRALNHYRRQSSRPKTVATVDDFVGVLAAETDTAQTVEDRFATAEALARIARLPKEQAEAVFLRSIVGLDVASAGEVLEKKPGAVRTSAHRGLRSLEKQLLEERKAEATETSGNSPPGGDRGAGSQSRKDPGTAGYSRKTGRRAPKSPEKPPDV